MKSNREWLGTMGVGVLIFLIAYGLTVLVYNRFERPPAAVSQKDTVKVGERITFPDMQPVNGSPSPSLSEKLTLVTAFSLKCGVSVQSVPFWMRLNSSLPRDKVNYIFLGCSESIADLKKFVQRTGLKGAIFFGTCEQIEPVFKIRGGITHCLLDKSGVCVSVWTGMPVNRSYETELIEEIVREVNKHSG